MNIVPRKDFNNEFFLFSEDREIHFKVEDRELILLSPATIKESNYIRDTFGLKKPKMLKNKKECIIQVKALRKKGHTWNRISELTGISETWCRELEQQKYY